MQQLLKNLSEQAYIEAHRSCSDKGTIKYTLWAHPASIDLLHVFSHVLMMDFTYKPNRYQLPFMEIVGVSSTEILLRLCNPLILDVRITVSVLDTSYRVDLTSLEVR